jgi:hypothetical protein
MGRRGWGAAAAAEGGGLRGAPPRVWGARGGAGRNRVTQRLQWRMGGRGCPMLGLRRSVRSPWTHFAAPPAPPRPAPPRPAPPRPAPPRPAPPRPAPLTHPPEHQVVLERGTEWLEHRWSQSRGQARSNGLLTMLTFIKQELFMLGLISMLLTAVQDPMLRIWCAEPACNLQGRFSAAAGSRLRVSSGALAGRGRGPPRSPRTLLPGPHCALGHGRGPTLQPSRPSIPDEAARYGLHWYPETTEEHMEKMAAAGRRLMGGPPKVRPRSVLGQRGGGRGGVQCLGGGASMRDAAPGAALQAPEPPHSALPLPPIPPLPGQHQLLRPRHAAAVLGLHDLPGPPADLPDRGDSCRVCHGDAAGRARAGAAAAAAAWARGVVRGSRQPRGAAGVAGACAR